MNEQNIKSELDSLKEIRNDLLALLMDKDRPENAFNNKVYEYREKRAEFLLELTKGFEVIKVEDPQIRKELKNFLKVGDDFIAEKKKDENENIRKLAKIFDEELKPEFHPKRLDELEFELFYNWFSPSQYVYGVIETGKLVIKAIDFPAKLNGLISELRSCLIFQNYIAAGIMLRTIIDVAVEDIMKKNFPNEEFDHLAKKIGFLKNQPKFSMSCSILSNYLNDLNDFVHGNKVIGRDKIKVYAYDIVLDRIQDLYEKSD